MVKNTSDDIQKFFDNIIKETGDTKSFYIAMQNIIKIVVQQNKETEFSIFEQVE